MGLVRTADESDECSLSCLVPDADSRTDPRHDELADSHSSGAEQKQRTAAPGFDHVQAGKCGAGVHSRCDHGDDKGVLETGSLKEGGTVLPQVQLSVMPYVHEYGKLEAPT